jgi:chemotaxis protein CheZ
MRDRLPMAHDELGSVVAATAGATNSIMEAAEVRDALAGDVLEGAGLEDLVDPALDLGAVAVEGRNARPSADGP